MDIHNKNKQIISKFRSALYDCDVTKLKGQLREVFIPDCNIQLAFPFEDIAGPDGLFEAVYKPLLIAIPDLERRDYIVTAGRTDRGLDWVGCAGYYTGTFLNPWLDIPPTGHMVTMRFHEFFRIENGKVVEFQGLWDIPDVMRQAGAWPMAPSLGREGVAPAPATCDGIVAGPQDEPKSAESCRLVLEMLAAMSRHPSQGGAEVMEMDRFWHESFSWYGPSGIGTGRGVSGFRNWHQIPFLNAMPDRGLSRDAKAYHFFGDGDYVSVTGWPNMELTLSHAGWLGIPPLGKAITLRSLDFWRVERGKIRENWVMVDLLDMYRQIGVDVFDRLREFNKARTFAGNPTYSGA